MNLRHYILVVFKEIWDMDGRLNAVPLEWMFCESYDVKKRCGEGGRKTANQLQFKLNPLDIFDLNNFKTALFK